MSWPAVDPADVPTPPATDAFVLEPLGPQHNRSDHDAWMSSIEFIRSLPGFAPGDWGDDDWPVAMSLDQNLGDLHLHADEFERGEAYAYTVLDPGSGAVIGCVYIDPDDTGAADAKVRSWVRESHADLDEQLVAVVHGWLRASWPFGSVRYVGRAAPSPAP